MSIIYSYPIIVPALDDLFVLSDASSTPKYSTRQATLSSIKDSLDVVDSITATLPISVSSATGSPNVSSRAYGGGSITGHVPAGGSVGQYLGGDGQWATASGSGTVTGTGVANQVAKWTTASNIGGDNELTFDSNTGTLQVGEFGGNGGLIIARAEDGVQSGVLSMEYKAGGTFLNLKVGDDVMTQTYNLVLPSNPASSGGQVLSSVGATGELAWTTPTTGGSSIGATGDIQYVGASTGDFNGAGTLNFNQTGTVSKLAVGMGSSTNNGVVRLKAGTSGETGTPSAIEFQAAGSQNIVSLQSFGPASSSYAITLPSAAPGSNNKILESNSSGALSWIDTPGRVLGYVPIDYAAATTIVTGNNANKAHAYQATPDSDFTCTKATILLSGAAPSFSGTNSGITVGIYTSVSTGIGTGAGNVLLGQGSKSLWSSDPYASITLSPVNAGDLDLVGGTAYVIVVRCIGAQSATGLLGIAGVSNVSYAANFASNSASLPSLITNELEVGATTFRPAITLNF